ncbi:MAG TPA: hypothetical protein VF681_07725 [Abditibacteriaceae bacterium]|jgi:hypothetical protein
MRPLFFLCAAPVTFALSARAATISSPTHPDAIVQTFEEKAAFVPYAVPGGVPSGAQLSVVKSNGNGALQLRNTYAGSFSVDFKVTPFDAQKFGDIYFDYKLTSDVKVNIFFRMNGVYHCAVFSGPPRVRPGGVLLGKIADVKAEGLTAGWRRAHIPLRDWLRVLYPTATSFPIDEVISGNWDNTGYLVAGFGGNGAGATWQMDNFAIVAAGGGEAKLEVAGAPAGATWTLDDGQSTPKAGKATPLAGAISVPARDGFSWVSVRDKAGALVGAWPLLQAASAPAIGEAKLENNLLSVEIRAPRGLDTSALALSVGDRQFDRASPDLRWRGDENRLVLDAARAGFSWKTGETVSVKLTGVKDLAGRTTPDKTLNVAVDFARGTQTTNLPRLIIDGATDLTDGSFERDNGGWTTSEAGGALVERDETVAKTGGQSLRMSASGNATPYRAWVRRQSFDAAKYPIVAFWYRAPANMRADFLLGVKGTTYGVKFTDRDNPSRSVGAIADVKADNNWHFASFNLAEMLKKARPTGSDLNVDWMAIGDTGWLGNARGTQYFIDDFRFVPAVATPLKARLQLDDVTGIKAVAWVVNESPESEVSTAPTAAGNNIEATGTGLKFVHARVQNGAGHWSQTVHIPVYLQ